MRTTLLLSLLLPLAGCSRSLDAGDEAFVHRAVQVTQGRNPYGPAEVEALLDILDKHGRRTVVRVLTDDEAYVDYWSRVLAEDLRIDRESKAMEQGACWDYPLLFSDDQVPRVRQGVSDALVQHLTTAQWYEPFFDNTCDSGGGGGSANDGDKGEVATDTGGGDPAAVSATELSDDGVAVAIVGEVVEDEPTPETGAMPSLDEGVLDYAAACDDLTEESLTGLLAASEAVELTMDGDTEGGIGPDLEGLPEPEEGLDAPGAGLVADPPQPCSFNMSDVVQASVRSDRMDAALRTWLYPTAVDGFPDIAQNVYLNQDVSCVGCHNGTYSTTDDRAAGQVAYGSSWDRHHPSPLGADKAVLRFDVEGSLYTQNRGTNNQRWGSLGSPALASTLETMRGATPIAGRGATGAVRPFGLVEECFHRKDDRNKPMIGFTPGFVAPTGPARATPTTTVIPGTSDLANASPIDFSESVIVGMALLHDDVVNQRSLFETEDWTGTRDATHASLCGKGCHDGGDPYAPDLPADARLLDGPQGMHPEQIAATIVEGSKTRRMSSQLSSRSDAQAIALALADDNDATFLIFRDAREALAWRAARGIVDRVAEEVLGRRLTLEHGSPRNEEAARLLAGLTWTFVASNYSLRTLLAELMELGVPNYAATDASGPLPYPAYFNPWTDAGPGGGGRDNDVGDAVHSRSSVQLVLSLYHALGWPRGHIFGYVHHNDERNNAWPFQRALARLGSFASPSIRTVDVTTNASWIDWRRIAGSGQKPDAVADRDIARRAVPDLGPYLGKGDIRIGYDADAKPNPTFTIRFVVTRGSGYSPAKNNALPDAWYDYVDTLVGDTAREGSSPTGDLSCAELLANVRGRILGVAELTSAELAWAQQENGQDCDFTQSTTSGWLPWTLSTTAERAEAEELVRTYLGTLLLTPDFLLAGLPADLPTAPRFVEGVFEPVCLASDPACTFDEWRTLYNDRL